MAGFDFEKEYRHTLGIQRIGQPVVYTGDDQDVGHVTLKSFLARTAEALAGDPGLRGRIDVPGGSELGQESPFGAMAGAAQAAREREPMTLGEAAAGIGTSVAGLGTGVAAGTAGLPGDIAALGYGLWRAANPEEDEGRLNAFIDGLSTVSETAGSEYFLNAYADWLEQSGVPADQAQLMRDAADIGSFATLEAAAVKAPAALRAGREWLASAPDRVKAREADTGTVLTSGVDPTKAADAIDRAIVSMQSRTPQVDRDELVNVLRLRADQMRLAPKDRIQPSGDRLFDTSTEAYQQNLPEQAETPVPRAPEGVKLPKGNRAAKVVDMTPQIAERLAERMRPFLDTPAQYFYNTGPLIAKAVELGIPEDVAREQIKKFALNYAATSPRTMTEQNLRNASLVTAKQERGTPIDKVIGPGGDGINEKGYPMMIGPSGIHRKLIDAVQADGIDYNTNPKPATFAENVMGNLQGVTVDTHAIRGALDAMNEIEPGSIPEGFIKPEFREQYKSDPSSFDPATMVDDTLASQKIDGVSMQTEYAVFSDLYKEAAKILGVSPAEAQSLGWFGSGERTGLASDLKTVVDLIDDRVDVTAQATGRSKEDVYVDFLSGKIPLLSFGGLTLMETGAMMQQTNNDETM